MDKSPEAFRTISEVAEEMDLPQHVLRFWETRFPQIKPLKRGGGRRYYRPDDVDLLRADQAAPLRRRLHDQGRAEAVARAGRGVVARGLAGREGAEADEGRRSGRRDAGRRLAPRRTPGRPRRRGDLAALRAILADLREAERLLSLSRGG